MRQAGRRYQGALRGRVERFAELPSGVDDLAHVGREFTPIPGSAWPSLLEQAIAPFGCRLALLDGGSVVVALAGAPKTTALRGARCAFALRGLLHDAAMIVVSEPAADGDLLNGAIERGVQMAEEAALQLMFA